MPAAERGWARTLGVLGLLALLVAGLGVVWVADQVPRDDVAGLTAGALAVADGVAGSWSVGTVEVTLSDDGLQMVDTARDDLVVWESPAQSAFVLGVLGEVSWEELRGYFWPTARHDCVLADQEVRSVTDDAGRLEISGLLSGCGQVREYLVTLQAADRSGDVVAEVSSRDVDALAWVTGRSDRTGVHGFGEQLASFDLSGRVIPIVVREQGVGRGEQPLTFLADITNRGAGGSDQMTSAAWPSFVTGDVRGVELDPAVDASHAFAVADTRDRRAVVLASWQPSMRVLLTAAAEPADLLVRRGAGIDRPGLPDWLLSGAVLGIQGGTEKVRTAVAELQQADAALSAVWLPDWSGTRQAPLGDRLWWTGQLDRDRYPGWEQLVRDLGEQDIRVLTYVSTWLVDAGENGEQPPRNLDAEAAASGYLVTDPDGEVYRLDQGGFSAALVDLTNPQARDWYADVIATEVLGAGADGFMADVGAGLPFDVVLTEGDPATEHNRWPALWAQTVREACERADKPDCVAWFRAGSGGMAGDAPLFSTGDQTVTYSAEDGMASALLGTFHAGLSGWHLTHSDTGGSTSIDARVRDYVRPPELNRRWAEMEAFGVVLRTHEGNRPRATEQVYDTPQSRDAFAAMTRLYASLAPYREQVVQEAIETGVPALRHTWVEYPGSLAAQSDTQFFFGPSVLVAPVLAEAVDTVSVAFPPGTWVHLLTGERYDGDQVRQVAAPLGTPAAFVRSDDPALPDLLAMVAGR